MAVEEPLYTIREQDDDLGGRVRPALIAAQVTVSGNRLAALEGFSPSKRI